MPSPHGSRARISLGGRTGAPQSIRTRLALLAFALDIRSISHGDKELLEGQADLVVVVN